MVISRHLLLVFLTTLASCNEAVPEGYRLASAAIAEAEQFRTSAADCREREWEVNSCAKAVQLYERIRSTPTHFATEAEWRQFSDAYQGGVELMLMGVLTEACDPAAKRTATARMKSMCSVRDPMKIQHVQEEMHSRQGP